MIRDNRFMAAPIAHLFLAAQFLAALPPHFFHEKEFMVGTSFPDIQYLQVIERAQTHFSGVTLQDILHEKNSFKAGMLFHSFVDEQREAFVVKNHFYEKIPNFKFRSQALKFAEDEFLKSYFDVLRYLPYFDEIIDEERHFQISDESIKNWHACLQAYGKGNYSGKDLLMKFFDLKEPRAWGIKRWMFSWFYLRKLDQSIFNLQKDEEAKSLILDFYLNFGDKMLTVPTNHPFSYDLGVKIIPGRTLKNEVTICCHGYGHNHEIVDMVSSCGVFSGNLVGFNFPDYNIDPESDHSKCSYGSINEILPLLYLVHYYACDLHIPIINLYGFSAGGGAVVNALAILNRSLHQEALAKIGITSESTKQIIAALERGMIVLECPLKSMEEVVAFRGKDKGLEILAAFYTKNHMNPIDVLPLLSGLKLDIVVHFQNPDELLSNRDDTLFVERLKKANKGKTTVIIGCDGGHNSWHESFWNYLKKNKTGPNKK